MNLRQLRYVQETVRQGLNLTEAARALLAKSDEIQITLVVIGVDYREESDLLKLEGVSLNFLD